MNMKYFKHKNAETFKEAGEDIKEVHRAVPIAGGTDLIAVLKEGIISNYPERIVNLKSIPNSACIEELDDSILIGALTKLCDLERSPIIKKYIPALEQAAHSVASPLIRNMATIGGNICQDVRCWYYRYPDEIGGTYQCARKNGQECYAILGRNKYHSIFGGERCGAPSCRLACPLNTDIAGYLEQIRGGKIDAAAELLLATNPMPFITCKICGHYCQNSCIRSNHDEPVAIPQIECTLGEYILNNEKTYYKTDKESGKRTAVIGAGLAGLSAAYYLRKAGSAVTVYDKHQQIGQALITAYSENQLPPAYINRYIEALKYMGIKFVPNKTIGADILYKELTSQYDIIIAEKAVKIDYDNIMKSEKEKLKLTVEEKEKIIFIDTKENAPSPAIHAISRGRNTAQKGNNKLGLKPQPIPKPEFLTYNYKNVNNAKSYYHNETRRQTDQNNNIKPAEPTTIKQAAEEAGRCQNCGCYSVNASDISPVLLALDATIHTTERKIPASEFFASSKPSKILNKGELVEKIEIPKKEAYQMGYLKLRMREAIDFAVTSLAYTFKIEQGIITEVSLAAGGVAPIPIRLHSAENYIKGKDIKKIHADLAAETACEGASLMQENSFKLQEIKVQIQQALTSLHK